MSSKTVQCVDRSGNLERSDCKFREEKFLGGPFTEMEIDVTVVPFCHYHLYYCSLGNYNHSILNLLLELLLLSIT
jgi:hypothetical protein